MKTPTYFKMKKIKDKEIKEIWEKFIKYASEEGYNRRVPDIGFMNKDGNTMLLRGEKKAVLINKNEVEDVEFVEKD